MDAYSVDVQKELFYLKTVEETFATLQSTKDGLKSSEASRRLEAHGPNALKEKPPVPGWKKFLMQFNDFLIWILIGAAIFSLIAAFIESATTGHPPEYADAIIIAVILFINAILGYFQEQQAEQAIDALKKMSAAKARTLRDGEIVEIFAAELVPGDVVVLETGDAVPADCRVIDSNELKVEEASLTGESMAVKKVTEKIDAPCSLGDRINLVFSSTIVTYGRGRAIVAATGMNTELGKIATFISETEDEATPLAKKIDAFGKKLGNLILLVCAISFVMYFVQGWFTFVVPETRTWLDVLLSSIMVAIALAVAAIPEGLPAIVTTSLALGVQRMAKRNAIVRKLPSVETLGCTTVICSDKTGTLTKNEMTIRSIFIDEKLLETTGDGYEPAGDFLENGAKIDPTSNEGLVLLSKAGVLCNNATLRKDGDTGKWVITGDPTEAAFLTLGGKLGFTRDGLEQSSRRVSEVFFSSERKKMTTVDVDSGTNEYLVAMKGGLEPMLPNCTRIQVNGKVLPLEKAHVDKLLAAQEQLSSKALRVLAVGYKTWKKNEVDLEPDKVERDIILLGLVGMIDPPRSEAKAAVARCKEAGINTIMITGDHAMTAKAIALELGILDQGATGGHHIIQGMEIDKLSDADLLECNVFARVAPEHKMRIVNALQASGHIVSMTGDGVNDAPALKKADAGVAMGITGTDVSKGAADIVLADDNFASIVAAVEEGRAIYDNMKRFINFLISCNLGEILVVFLAALLGLPVPLLAIHLLWVNLLTDGLPALAMGFEKPDADLMVRPPRPPQEPIITPRNTLSYITSGLFIAFSCVITFWWGLGALNHTYEVTIGLAQNFPADVQLDTSYFAALPELQTPGPISAALAAAGYSPEQVTQALRFLTDDTGLLLLRPRTLAFSSLVLSESMNAFNCRSEHISIFKKKLSDNYFLAISIGITLSLNLAVIYIPAAAAVFKITGIGIAEWLFVIVIASPRIWSEEIVKTYWKETHVAGTLDQKELSGGRNILFDIISIVLPPVAAMFFLVFGILVPPADHAVEQGIVTVALVISLFSYIFGHYAITKAKKPLLAMIMAMIGLIVALVILVDFFAVFLA